MSEPEEGEGEPRVAPVWRRWIPRSWPELVAMVGVIAALLAVGGWASRELFPKAAPVPWQQKIDAVCLHYTPRIAGAERLRTLSDQRLEQARLETDFATELERVSRSVPIEETLGFDQLVRDHQGIAYWRRIVGRREADIATLPTAVQLKNLRQVEAAAVADAELLGLGICSQIAPKYQ